LCAEIIAEERSRSTEECLSSEADLRSAYLFSLASVKKVLSRVSICLKKGHNAALYLTCPATAGHPLLEERKKRTLREVFRNDSSVGV
jgi:hypothetical protein